MPFTWVTSADDIRRADESPWDGPLAGMMRPLTYRTTIGSAVATALMYGVAGMMSATGAAFTDRLPGSNGAGLIACAVFAFLAALAFAGCLLFLSPRTVRVIAPAVGGASMLVGAGVLVTANLLSFGPSVDVGAASYVSAPVFAFYLLHRRWAWLCVAVYSAEYAFVVTRQHLTAPVAHWLTITVTVGAVGALIGPIGERAEQLQESEAAARKELADINRTLEDRVAAQVDELESLNKLRRFLSPQIAEAVSQGSDTVLEPHRCKIAVFFCDLRGFTAFTTGAEPEDVVETLAEYYRTVGEVLRAHNATIGGYAGDGIMAYFGDPVPSPDPAFDAATTATELAERMTDLLRTWRHRGHDLGYGAGIAYGYATLGVIGFDGRFDYTPLGSVVNLAARLCAKASSGQTLLDHAAQAAIAGRIDTTPVPAFDLKGFGADMRAYELAAPDRAAGA